MSVVSYVGMIGVVLVIAVAVQRFEPAVVEQLSRQIPLDRAKGWTTLVVASCWSFLPFLFGADSGGSDLWFVGSATALAGFYLLAISFSSLDEHGVISRAKHLTPEAVSPAGGDELVAVDGVPTVDEDVAPETPFSGVFTVYTDWLVQRRHRIGLRKTWHSLASGVQTVTFSLGDGCVRIAPGRARVFTDAETSRTLDPDEALPDRIASFSREHEDLPGPMERDVSLRFTERLVPADEPVTVVGTPRQGDEPGTLVIDEGPPDRLLGTHADPSFDDGADPEPVLIRGDFEKARARLHRRVYWFGAASGAMIFGGQGLAFWLSAASLGGLF